MVPMTILWVPHKSNESKGITNANKRINHYIIIYVPIQKSTGYKLHRGSSFVTKMVLVRNAKKLMRLQIIQFYKISTGTSIYLYRIKN